jgi:hypothetical protein
MAQFHILRIERSSTGFSGDPFYLARGNKEELCFVIDKPLDEPRAGHAIDMNM